MKVAWHLCPRLFLVWLILRPWRWRHLPPKRQLTLNVLHGVISPLWEPQILQRKLNFIHDLQREIFYFSFMLCVKCICFIPSPQYETWKHHTFVVPYKFRVIKPPSSIWFFTLTGICLLVFLHWSVVTHSNVVICNTVIHKNVFTSEIKY
jgi:hypothetical protein